jgi:hypothetical protein
MLTIGTKLLGFLLLVLVAAMPLGCGSTDEGPRDERSEKDVKVGGDKGVVVEHSKTGTTVKVGGDHGVVVDHPRDPKDDDHK